MTVSLTDSQGDTVREATFETEVPQTASGYDTILEYTQGDSEEELTGGLYYTLGTQGYYGHMFFYDNEGVMRYEMLLDGYKADRILTEGSDIIFCVSADQIGRMNPLGQVVRLYETKGYDMHHDFNWVMRESFWSWLRKRMPLMTGLWTVSWKLTWRREM